MVFYHPIAAGFSAGCHNGKLPKHQGSDDEPGEEFENGVTPRPPKGGVEKSDWWAKKIEMSNLEMYNIN